MAIIHAMSMLERAEAAERAMSEELDRTVVKSVIYVSGDRDPRLPLTRPDNGKLVMMGQDPRLPRMPERPTLLDFFKYRFGPANHLMQSARLAQKNGVAEKLVLACLLHDIGIAGFIRGDHGYWAAQLLEPYVDEEVSWAIRYHQALRFFPDASVGYAYPQMYIKLFGADYYATGNLGYVAPPLSTTIRPYHDPTSNYLAADGHVKALRGETISPGGDAPSPDAPQSSPGKTAAGTSSMLISPNLRAALTFSTK